MIKLNDFARERGVTDRQVQRLIKKYEVELEGLFVRKGPNGTWLSDEACDILRSKMKTQDAEVYDDTKDKKIKELEEQLKSKEQYITALEAGNIAKQNLINELEQKRIPLLQDQLEIQKHDFAEKEKEMQELQNQQNEKISNLQSKIEAKDELIQDYERKAAEEAAKSKWQRFKEIWR